MFSLDAQERAGAKYIVCMDDAYSYGNTEQQNYWEEWKDKEQSNYRIEQVFKNNCDEWRLNGHQYTGEIITDYASCMNHAESQSLFYN